MSPSRGPGTGTAAGADSVTLHLGSRPLRLAAVDVRFSIIAANRVVEPKHMNIKTC